MTSSKLPFVSIIVPILNEADFIEEVVKSVLDNDYPNDKYEILIVDGGSNDGTIAIVKELQTDNPNIKLLDNPARIQTIAMNIGIRESKGDVFVRVDGHAWVPKDFISKSIECLLAHPEAWVAGGYIENVASGYIGNTIAAAMQSPVGVGNAMFRLGDYEGWVDTLAFGMHHKWIVDKIGYFDESLARNEDDDFNMRIHLAGGKIWMSKSVASKYYTRSSLKKLWKQYYQYGFWRIRTIQKHKKPATIRQMIPLLFVSSLLTLCVLSVFSDIAQWLLLAEVIVYSLGLGVGMLDVVRKGYAKYAILTPLIFTLLHFGYGVGCLWGIVRFVIFRGKGMPSPENCKLTR